MFILHYFSIKFVHHYWKFNVSACVSCDCGFGYWVLINKMFNNFTSFYIVGVNLLHHHFTILNSFHPIPQQHLFGPFSACAQSVPHHTRYTPPRASSHWPRHTSWSRISRLSVDDCFEGSDMTAGTSLGSWLRS